MNLPPGTRLGPYEIVSPLGAGGMGEVYRARDGRLSRDVAIKVLAPSLAQDKHALARFEREAKAASALNHPHIVHIYEIGEAETPEGRAPYIAMELVQGQTLRARLKSGARWKTLIEPLAQAADALARAHGAGVIHRDLKPENVMITPDGYPKVLDFGLAKLAEDRELASRVESSPTADLAGRTGTGVIVGTPGYMSPEQVRGEPLDLRSDVFSFGCILYEAATGRAPFGRESSVATLHAVAYEEPASLETLNAEAPPELRRIVLKCLEKDAERRYQTIKGLADDLRALARAEATPSPDSALSTAATREMPKPAWPARHWLVTGGVAGVVVAVIGLTELMRTERDVPTRPASGAAIQVEKLTSRGNVDRAFISPDGRYLAYVSPEQDGPTIWLRDLTEKTETRLVTVVEAEAIETLVFARDGQAIYYSFAKKGAVGVGKSGLFRIPLIGGEPRIVRTNAFEIWSPDKKRVAFLRRKEGKQLLFIAEWEGTSEKEIGESEGLLAWSADASQLVFARLKDGKRHLFVVRADGTGERKVGELDQEPGLPRWKPDGTSVAFLTRTEDKQTHRLYAITLATGAVAQLGQKVWREVWSLDWLPDSSSLIVVASSTGERGEIWRVSYPSGEAERAPADARDYGRLSMTADGTKLVAVQKMEQADLLVSASLDKGMFRKLESRTDLEYSVCWTVDGKIVYSSNEAGSYDLYVIDPDGSNRRQLTFDRNAHETEPAASPDGRYLVFVSERPGNKALHRIDRDGTGLVTLVTMVPTETSNPRQSHRGPQVTPDGRWVFFRGWDIGPTLWKVPIEGGTPTLVIGARTATLEEKAFGTSVSPDGNSLAFFYFSFDPPRRKWSATEIAIGALDGRPIKTFPHVASVGVGDHDRVQWSRDGTALYYRQRQAGINNLWMRPVSGGPPVQLTRFEDSLVDFDWSFDGKMLVCSRSSSVSDAVLITNFR